MCLAVPLQLIERCENDGIGEFDGVRRKIRLDFVSAAKPGDYLLVHAGFAIEIVDPVQAKADREAYREVLDAANP